MGLLQKLKSALGLDGARSAEPGTASPRDVDVTVEREPSSPSEDAVKGTETTSSAAATEPEPEPEPETEAAEPSVEATASTGESEAADETEAPEGTETPDETEAADETDTLDETEAAGDTEDESESATGERSAAVTEINGIGPAYGQRLADAGVETVADLAAADADELAAATDISANRIEGWIDAAAAY